MTLGRSRQANFSRQFPDPRKFFEIADQTSSDFLGGSVFPRYFFESRESVKRSVIKLGLRRQVGFELRELIQRRQDAQNAILILGLGSGRDSFRNPDPESQTAGISKNDGVGKDGGFLILYHVAPNSGVGRIQWCGSWMDAWASGLVCLPSPRRVIGEAR